VCVQCNGCLRSLCGLVVRFFSCSIYFFPFYDPSLRKERDNGREKGGGYIACIFSHRFTLFFLKEEKTHLFSPLVSSSLFVALVIQVQI